MTGPYNGCSSKRLHLRVRHIRCDVQRRRASPAIAPLAGQAPAHKGHIAMRGRDDHPLRSPMGLPQCSSPFNLVYTGLFGGVADRQTTQHLLEVLKATCDNDDRRLVVCKSFKSMLCESTVYAGSDVVRAHGASLRSGMRAGASGTLTSTFGASSGRLALMSLSSLQPWLNGSLSACLCTTSTAAA